MSIVRPYVSALPDALRNGWYSFKRTSTLKGIRDALISFDENIGHANRNLVRNLKRRL